MKKIFTGQFYIILFIIMFSTVRASENKITAYDIRVTVPDSYEYLQVEATMNLQFMENIIEFRLCEGFKGVMVKDINIYYEGFNPDYTFKDNILKIRIPEKSEITGKTIDIKYKLYPDKNYEDKYADFAFDVSEEDCHINAAITRTDNWFPRLKDSYADRLPSFNLSIDVPEEFEVMASGKLYYVSENQKRKVYKWKNYEEITDRSLYFFAGKCEKVVKTFEDGFNVILYIPFEHMEENVDFISQVIYKSYKFFEERFGETGLTEYKAMATPYGYSGLFNSMTLGEEYFTDEIVHNEIMAPTRYVIHEVSHTWWGNILSFDAERDYWLFEGFAKFSEIIALKEVLGKDIELESFKRLKLLYMPYYGYDMSVQDAGHIDDRNIQSPVAYYKGALVLKTMELIMGEEAFFTGMKDYVKIYRGKAVVTEDFKNVMKKYTDKNLDKFFQEYLEDSSIGEYEISLVDSRKEGDIYITKFKIENTGGKDIYTEIGVKTYLEDYSKKLYLGRDSICFLDVKNTEPAGLEAVKPDNYGIYLICENGLRGAGGFAFKNADKYQLWSIIKEGPLGKAGLKEGAVLLEIDEKKCSSMDLYEINRLLVHPEGTELNLLVEDEGEKSVTVFY